MSFPSTQEFIELNKLSKNNLIDLYVLKGDEEEVTRDPNLKSWEIVSVSSTWIEIDLIFHEPLLVSQGSEYDKLVI